MQLTDTCTCDLRTQPGKMYFRGKHMVSTTYVVADAASRPVEVLLRKGAASASGADLTAAESPDVVWLTGLGYGAAEALAALQANAGDREAGLASLYAALTGEAAAVRQSCQCHTMILILPAKILVCLYWWRSCPQHTALIG